MPADVKIQLRRGLDTQWNTVDPILSEGEPGYNSSTGEFKIGDSTSKWSELADISKQYKNVFTVAKYGKNGFADYICSNYDSDASCIQAAIDRAASGSGGKIVLFKGDYIKNTIAGIMVPSNIELEIDGNISLAANVGDGAAIFQNSDAENGNSNISIIGNGNLNGDRINQSTGVQNGIIFTNVSRSKIEIAASGFSGRALLVTGGSHNYIRNKLYPNVDVLETAPKLLTDMLSYPGVRVLDPIDSSDGWTATDGVVTWDSSLLAVGNSSAKITMSTWNAAKTKWEGTISKTFSTPLSISSKDFIGILTQFPSSIPYPTLVLVLHDGTNTMSIYTGGISYDMWDSGVAINDWQIFGASPAKEDYISETLINLTNITSIDIIARSSVENSEIWVDGIFSIKPLYPEGSIILTVDDGFESVYDYIAPLMMKYGHRGVAFVNPGVLGTPSAVYQNRVRMLGDKIKELNKIGWDVCNHTYNHTDMNATIGEAEEEILLARDWLISNGCTDVAFCYPHGAASKNTFPIVKQYYPLSRRTGASDPRGTLRPLPLFGSMDMFSSQELTDSTLAAVKTLVTAVSTTATNLIVYMHHVDIESGLSYSISLTNFIDFLAHVEASKVRVITFSELMLDIKNKIATLNPNYKTTNTGTSTVSTGSTSVVVNHGLVAAPTKYFAFPGGNLGNCWIDTVTSTQMTIHCSTAPESDTAVSWSAQVV